ncbi:hypothetical protein [Gordonia phthalatica]|uniref:Pullulanase n=1 Tax=Gordonia phthalatica TaxID=1136941 RepID=A0A0N9NFI0_9ACTN|nr:hypothetical protein [Gordonia phthalatica]ALG86448.1 hypothetical protein ACH46_20575 [Gordonia phthalatica]
MDPAIEYFFGTGDGTLHRWTSPADLNVSGDGTLDAVTLDFDGDGLDDDAMWDSDGDGVADLVLLDLDDDGVPETRFSDGGRGLWEIAADPDGSDPGSPPSLRQDVLDTDGDGVPDLVLLDTDGDGFADDYRPADGSATTGSSTSGSGGGPSAR